MAHKAMSLVNQERLNSVRIMPVIIFASPSLAFKTILPTKPSQTTISTVPLKISLPSTFPKKFNWLLRNNSPASLTTSLPLITSSPMFSNPIVGEDLPSTTRNITSAICANCNKLIGKQSALAPKSSTVVPVPNSLGMAVAIAGRSIPSRVFSR